MKYIGLAVLFPLSTLSAPVVTHQVQSATGQSFASYFAELRYDIFDHGEPLHIQEVTAGGQSRLSITDELGEVLWESGINPRSPIAREQIEQVAQHVQSTLDQRNHDSRVAMKDDLVGDGL